VIDGPLWSRDRRFIAGRPTFNLRATAKRVRQLTIMTGRADDDECDAGLTARDSLCTGRHRAKSDDRQRSGGNMIRGGLGWVEMQWIWWVGLGLSSA